MDRRFALSAAVLSLVATEGCWAQQSTGRTSFTTIGAFAAYIPGAGTTGALFKVRERATAYFPLFPEGTQVVVGGRGIDEKAETWRARSTSSTGDTSVVVEFDVETAKIMGWAPSLTSWTLHFGADDRVISSPGARLQEAQIVLQSPLRSGQSWVAGLDKHEQPIVRRVRNFRDISSPVGCCEAAVIDVLRPEDEVGCQREFWVRGVGLVEVRRAFRHPDGVGAQPRDTEFMRMLEILLPGQKSRRSVKGSATSKPRAALSTQAAGGDTVSLTMKDGRIVIEHGHAAAEKPSGRPTMDDWKKAFSDPMFGKFFGQEGDSKARSGPTSHAASPSTTSAAATSVPPSLPRSIAGISLGEDWQRVVSSGRAKLVEPTRSEALFFAHFGIGSDVARFTEGGVFLAVGKRVIVESNLRHRILGLKLRIPDDTEAYARKMEERLGVKPKSFRHWEDADTAIGIIDGLWDQGKSLACVAFEDKKLSAAMLREVIAERERVRGAEQEASRHRRQEEQREQDEDVEKRAAKMKVDF